MDLRSLKQFVYYMGPGFIVGVAYMDPGNWAANMNAGSKFGTNLLWVIVASSIIAMGIQIVTAKLGIATGKGISELCRERLPKKAVVPLWIAAELAMVATDMAEILGAAIGFSLLFNIPITAGAVLAGVSAFALLGVRTAFNRGYRYIEVAITAMVAVVALGFVFEMVLANPTGSQIVSGLVPEFPTGSALYASISILGATIMPHSVYLHPKIVQARRRRLIEKEEDTEEVHRKHLNFESKETVLALSGTMFVNGAMLIVAAAALQGTGISSLQDAYITINTVFGSSASEVFGLALVVAGLASSIVATMAGQEVMDGFMNFRINVWVRRTLTLIPSIAVVAMGFNPTEVLVASQAALSFELPFVLIPLVYFTMDRKVMGGFANNTWVNKALSLVVSIIVVLNVILLYQTLF